MKLKIPELYLNYNNYQRIDCHRFFFVFLLLNFLFTFDITNFLYFSRNDKSFNSFVCVNMCGAGITIY